MAADDDNAWLDAIRTAAANGDPIAFDGALFPDGSQAAKAATRFVTYLNGGEAITVTGTNLISAAEEPYVELEGTASFKETAGSAVVMTFGTGDQNAPLFACEFASYEATLSDLFAVMEMPSLSGTLLTTLFPDKLNDLTLSLFANSDQGPMLEVVLAESEQTYTAFNYLELSRVGFSILRGCASALEADPKASQDSVEVSLSGAIALAQSEIYNPLYIGITLPNSEEGGVWSLELLNPVGVANISLFVTEILDNLFHAAGILGENGLSQQVPASLIDSTGFLVEQMTLTVENNSYALKDGSVVFTSSNSWIPVKGVVLNDVSIGLGLTLAGTKVANLSVSGGIQIGELVFLSAQANVPVVLSGGDQPDWSLSIQGSIDMGSGSGLSLDTMPMFSGSSPLLQPNDVPDAFLELEKFVVTNFAMTFNPFNLEEGIISTFELYLVANLEAGWDGILTLKDPKFTVDLEKPFVPAERKIDASAGLTVKFGDHLSFLVTGSLKVENGVSIWSIAGATGNSFTLQDAADDIHKELVFLTGLELPPVRSPGFLGAITIVDLGVFFTTKGPESTVDWKLTFDTPWQDPIAFAGHVGILYKDGSRKPDVTINLTLDLTETVHVTADINIGAGNNPNATNTSFRLQAVSDTPFTFDDMKRALNLPNLPEIPSGFDPRLKSMTFDYDNATPFLSATMDSETYGKASTIVTKIAAPKAVAEIDWPEVTPSHAIVPAGIAADQWSFGFGLNLDKRIDLSNLPVLGKFLPDNLSFGFDKLALALAYPGLPKSAAEMLFDNIGRTGGFGDWKGNFRAAMALELFLASYNVPLSFAFGDSAPASGDGHNAHTTRMLGVDAAALDADAPPASGKNTVNWIDIQRSFGPLTVRRVGLSMSDDGMAFPLDAALAFAGLMVEVDGLQIGLPFEGMSEKFGISGLGLSFNSPPINVGAALKIASDAELAEWTAQNGGNPISFAFSGIAMLRASERFSLAGVGGYAQLQSAPAFFVFAEAVAPLGGPPILQITGASAGLGVNYRMRQPSLNEVATNPFVAGLFPKTPGAGPLSVLNSLTKGPAPWLSVHEGDFWLALGVEFTIAQTLSNKAVGILSIGTPLQLGLYGISNLSLPKGAGTTLAKIEIAWMASVIPLELTFTAGGTLTPNSHILVDAARITGGFWVYLRGAEDSPYMGFSIGGFRAGYTPTATPAIPVPRLDRLGFDWRINSNIYIKGGAYFALVPNAMMVGGSLTASFSYSIFRAWFDLTANFIINWQPQTFIGDLAVTVGVSVTIKVWFVNKTFSGEFHIDVHVEGPPLQGKAHLRFMGIPIDVSFNWKGGVSNNKYVSWPAFERESLPPADQRATIKVGAGQLAAPQNPAFKRQAATTQQSVCSTNGFVMIAETVVPATSITINGGRNFSGKAVDIRPVNAVDRTSTVSLTITRDGNTVPAAELDRWGFEGIKTGVPTAQWGRPNQNRVNLDEAPMVSDSLVGVRIATTTARVSELTFTLAGGRPGNTAVGIDYEPIPVADAAILPFPGPPDTRGPLINDPNLSQQAMHDINGVISEPRAALHKVLTDLGFTDLIDGDLAIFAANADVILPSEPRLTGATA